MRWFDEFGAEIFINSAGDRIPEPQQLGDESPFVSRIFLNNKSDGFETFTALIPNDLRGGVGSFEIKPLAPINVTTGFGFTAQVLVDDFRLIDSVGQPAGGSPEAPAPSPTSSPGDDDPTGGANQFVSAPAAAPGVTPAGLIALTGDPATSNNILRDLNASMSTPNGPVPTPYPNLVVLGNTTLFVGASETTATSISQSESIDSVRRHFGLTDVEAQAGAAGERAPTVRTTAQSGEGLVTTQSAVGPFGANPRVSVFSLSNGDQAGTLKGLVTSRMGGASHLALASDVKVQGQIVTLLGHTTPSPSGGAGAGGHVISDSQATINLSGAVTLLHDGVDIDVHDPQAQTIFSGQATGAGVVTGVDVGGHSFQLTGVGGPYFVQARNVNSRQTGGATDSGSLTAGQQTSTGFDLERIFADLGVDDFLELGDLSLTINLDVTISPAGITLHPGTTVALQADHAALFPDSSHTDQSLGCGRNARRIDHGDRFQRTDRSDDRRVASRSGDRRNRHRRCRFGDGVGDCQSEPNARRPPDHVAGHRVRF